MTAAEWNDMRLKPWTVAAIVVAAVFFALAVSHAVYELTSPHALSWHVLLRKTYSIVAFTIVGYLLRRALVENGRVTNVGATCIAGVAVYSACIEAGQYLHGAREGLTWNTIDTICGAIGGALATCDLAFARKARA